MAGENTLTSKVEPGHFGLAQKNHNPEEYLLSNDSTFDLNKSQGAAKTKLTNEDKSEKSSEKSLEEQSKLFLQMMVTQLKNQDPENPTDSNQMTQTHAMMNNAMESTKQTKALEKMQKNMEKSALDQNQVYLGQELYYEDNMRPTAGGEVEFNYNINFDSKNLAENENLYAHITIRDSEDNAVFTQQNVPSSEGRNAFVWSSIDNDFRKVEPGDYTIEVQGFVQQKDAVYDEEGYNVSTDTTKHGKVTSIEPKGYNDVRLMINDTPIDKEQIVKISSENESSGINNSSKIDYVNYIGKEATVARDNLKIDSGFADFSFNNHVKNPGRAMIKVQNSQGEPVAMDLIDKKYINYGETKIENWQADKTITKEEIAAKNNPENDKSFEKIAPGWYKMEVFVEDLDQGEDAFTQIDTSLTGNIEKVNLQDNSIVINGQEYEIDDIIAFSQATGDNRNSPQNSNIANTFLNEANKFIGKGAVVSHNLIEHDGGIEEIPTQLSSPEALKEGAQYGKLYLNIYDNSGEKIATREMSEEEVNYLGKVSVPGYEEFSKSAKDKIDEFINNQILNQTEPRDQAENSELEAIEAGQNSSQETNESSAQEENQEGESLYNQLDSEDKDKVDNFIRENFYTGNLLTRDLEEMSDNDRARELQKIQGINYLTWQGSEDITNSNVDKGYYKYDFEVELLDNSGSRELKNFTNTGKVEIVSVINNNDGSFVLEGADGTKFYPEQIDALTKL